MTQETEWVRQTGQDTAPRGRKSPFDTDNLNHLLWGSKLLYQPGKSFRNSVCKRIWVQITVRSMQEWVVVFSRLPNKCHGKCSPCSIKAECRPAKQERRHPSMQQDNTEQQRDNWNSESEGGGAYVSTAQCLPSSNKHEPSPIVSGAPVVHYVNIRPVPHHDYIQTPSRKWSHTQRPPQPSSLRWWTFLAADLPNQETGVDGERAGSSRGGR